MRVKTKLATLGIAGLLAAAFGAPASAVTTTWNFNAGAPTCSTAGAGDTLSRTCGPAPSVTATGWANTGGGGNTLLEQAYLPLWGGNGLGVENRDRPGGPGDGGDDTENSGTYGEHAIDNEDRKDAVLLTFATPVKLTDIEINWRRASDRSDMTVLAFTGGDVGSCAAIAGQTYAALTNCGWNFVRTVASAPVGSFQTINNASVYSQYWLIGSYISDIVTGLATDVQSIGGALSSKSDHVKLLAVRGDPNGRKVPEPATLGLLGIAALGFWRLRRKA